MTWKVPVIFLHELKILLKDKQAIGLLFVMPLALIIFLTLALQDVYQMKFGKTVELEIVSGQSCGAPHGMCSRLVSEMKRFQYKLSVTKGTTPSPKARMALILPRNIEDTVEHLKEGKTLRENEQVQLVFDPTLDQSLRSLVQGHLLLALQAVLIDQVHDEMTKMAKEEVGNGGSSRIPSETIPNVSRFEGLVRERAVGGMQLPNPIQQTVPAWALFGMFFIVIPISSSMIRDRNLGIFKRLLSFPVSKTELLMGKILPFILINFLQFSLMFAVGVFILPRFTHLNLSLNFSLWGVLVVTVVSTLAATGYGLMVSCLSKTQEQAAAFGALSVVILAVLGGVMIPRLVMPEFMQNISQLSPLYWGLEAYYDVILRKATALVLVRKLTVLFVFSMVCASVSLLRFRWNEV